MCGIIANNGAGGYIPFTTIAPYSGNQVLWLQYFNVSGTATTTISNLSNGFTYTVSYMYSRRPSNNNVNCTIAINGTVMKTYTGGPGSETQWTSESITFTATGTTATMVLTSGGVSDQTMIFDGFTVT